MTTGWKEEFVEVGGTKVQMLKGGSGDPLLVLHGAGGNPRWLQYQNALAQQFQVYVPSHPGFGTSDRPEWLETMADMACFYGWMLEEMGLVGIPVLGSSMGGWLAAEIAVNCPHFFSKLVLVGAAGIKPIEGEITDIFIMSPQQVTERMFFDPKQAPEYEELYVREPTPEEQEIATRNREMSVRLCWKPYMHDPRLPALLARVKIPSLIVWGRQDGLVPLNCGELYHKALRGSTLKVIENCGHSPQVERPEEFVQIAQEFLSET